MCHFVSTVPFLTLGCFRLFHPVLAFFSLCFLPSFLCVLLPGKVNHHMTLCLTLILAPMSQVWGPQLLISLVNESPTTFTVSRNADWTTASAEIFDHVAKKAFPHGVCMFFLRLPGCPPTVRTLGHGWLETQSGSPRIGWVNWAGMSRS